MTTAENSGQGMANNAARELKDKAREAGEKTFCEASNKVEELRDRASNKAQEFREKGDRGLSSLGVKMSDIADTIREKAPTGGSIGTAAGAVADSLESSGEYLSQHGMEQIAKDVTQVVRRYPVASLWMGIGVGVLLGSVLSSRR